MYFIHEEIGCSEDHVVEVAHAGYEEKKKERLIYKAPPIKCEYGVKSNYGLVPSELGIGHYCGHMVDYGEVDYFYGKYNFLFEQSTRKMLVGML